MAPKKHSLLETRWLVTGHVGHNIRVAEDGSYLFCHDCSTDVGVPINPEPEAEKVLLWLQKRGITTVEDLATRWSSEWKDDNGDGLTRDEAIEWGTRERRDKQKAEGVAMTATVETAQWKRMALALASVVEREDR